MYIFTSIFSLSLSFLLSFFFFNDTATTEIYTLSLHDALPICEVSIREDNVLVDQLSVVDTQSITSAQQELAVVSGYRRGENFKITINFLKETLATVTADRKSTRLNSSHSSVSRMPSSA